MTPFEGKIRKSNLYPFYRGVNVIVDECKVNIGPTGILIDEVDPANVCRVSAKLPMEMFELYKLPPLQTPRPAVDLNLYSEIIHKDLDDNTIFEFKLIAPTSMDRNDALLTKINHTAYKHYTLNPMSIRRTQKELDLPESLNLTVPLKLFIEGIEAVENIKSESILIGVDFVRDNPTFYIRSFEDGDGVNTEIRLIDILYCDKPFLGSVTQSLFPMDYMSEIIKGLSEFKNISSDNVLLKLNNDHIIQITQKNELTGAELNYFLAPRIEDD